MSAIKKIYLIVFCFVLFSCSKPSAIDHLNLAKLHLKSGEYKAANIELKNALKLTPKLAEARFLLGKVYLHQRQYDAAENQLNRALQYKYPANKVVPLLSQAYQKTQSDNALIKLSHKQKNLTRDQEAQIAFYKLQAYVRLNKIEQAKALINEIKLLKTNSAFKSLVLVYAFLLDKNHDAALILLNTIIVKHPQQADALKLKASVLLAEKKRDQAIDVYRHYVKYYPDDIETSFMFARLLTDANKTVEAEPIIDNLLKLSDKNMLLNQLKAIARFNAKDYKKALFYSEKAISVNPQNTSLRLIAGISAYLEKNYQVANDQLSFIADKLPPSHPALRLLAASQLELGLTLDANKTLLKLTNITSKDTNLFSSVGLALIQKGEITKAKNILKKSPKVDNKIQTSNDALARLGLFKLSLNDVSGILNLESALKGSTQQLSPKQADNKQLLAKEDLIKQTLATAYLSTKQYDKALNFATRWQQQQPNNAQPYLLAGLVYRQKKQPEQAKIAYHSLLKVQPNNVKAKLAILDLVESKNTQQQNKKALNSILNIQADFMPALIRLYQIDKQADQVDVFISRLKKTIKAKPKNKMLPLLLARIYLSKKQFSASVKLLEQLKNEQVTPAPFWALLGQNYIQLQQYKKAKQLYQEWITKDPNSKEATLGNLVDMISEGKDAAALALTQQYIKTHGNDLQMQLLQTYLLVLNKQFKQARMNYDKLPNKLLKLPFTQGVLGQLQLHSNNLQSALQHLLVAYQARQSSRNAHLVMLVYLKLHQKTRSLLFLEKHVKNHPQDQTSLMTLASLQLQKDSNSAMASYIKVIKLNAKNGIAQNNLAFLYMQQGKLDLALQHAQQARRVMPSDQNILDTLGQIYFLKKDNKSALKVLTKAVANTKVTEEIYLNYIKALLLNNQRELAIRKIKQRTITSKKLQIRLKQLKAKFKLKL